MMKVDFLRKLLQKKENDGAVSSDDSQSEEKSSVSHNAAYSIMPQKEENSHSFYYNYLLSRFENKDAENVLSHDSDSKEFSRITESATQASQMLADLEAEWKQLVDESDFLKKELSSIEDDIAQRSETIKQLIKERSASDKANHNE